MEQSHAVSHHSSRIAIERVKEAEGKSSSQMDTTRFFLLYAFATVSVSTPEDWTVESLADTGTVTGTRFG
jgi:hypothetical protein